MVTRGINGDYDSDTMLMTDNELLIEVAQRHYKDFLVPTNCTSSVKTVRYYTQEQKADLDVKTSVNKIGEIINLSQQLNSLMWDRMNHGKSLESCQDLYNDICKLAVLSNVEIDRAKREFIINSTSEINILKEKYKITDDDKTVKPMFFKMITLENGFVLSDGTKYKYFDTAMDYLQKIISKFNFREGREQKKKIVPFMDMVKPPEVNVRQGYYYSQKDKLVKIIRESREEKKRLFCDYDILSPDEKNTVWAQAGEIKQNCIDAISEMSISPAVMYLTLKEIDNKEYSDIARYIFEVLFGKPDEAFYKLLIESKEDVYTLEECADGDIQIYDYRFKKVPLSKDFAEENAEIA